MASFSVRVLREVVLRRMVRGVSEGLRKWRVRRAVNVSMGMKLGGDMGWDFITSANVLRAVFVSF